MTKKQEDKKPAEVPSGMEAGWWLLDAPLFIDKRLIDEFFNAVFLPDSKPASTSDQGSTSDDLSGKIEASLMAQLIPGFLKGGVKSEVAAKKSETATTVKLFQFVDNPVRQLIGILLGYTQHDADRLIVIRAERQADSPKIETLGGKRLAFEKDIITPRSNGLRPLVFVDIAPRTPILPTAGEFQKGPVQLLYRSIISKLNAANPKAPRLSLEYSDEMKPEVRQKYWDDLFTRFVEENGGRVCMETLEEASDNGPTEWLDFRVPVAKSGEVIHLHFQPRGEYPMGTFAYNFVHRGFKNGMRIVGSLRSGGSINVLAMYDV